MTTAFILAIAFLIGLASMFSARKLALSVGLVDHPNERKQHRGVVPLAGGPGLFVTLLVTALIVSQVAPVAQIGSIALVLGALAFFLGLADDALDLPARLRLVLQAGIALLFALVFDIRIHELGNVFGFGDVHLGAVLSTLVTCFCVIGALNATNMTDGLDGLLASLIAMSLGALIVMAIVSLAIPEPLCMIVIGALCAFLAFNLGVFGEHRRIFLGDSGSTLLGLVIAVLLVGYSQGPRPAIQPVVAGWLLGLPLLDTTVVMARRLYQRRSPLEAGRDHLHHLLQRRGLSPRLTLLVMVALHAGMLGIAFLAQASLAPAWVFLYGFVALTVAYFAITRNAIPEDESECMEPMAEPQPGTLGGDPESDRYALAQRSTRIDTDESAMRQRRTLRAPNTTRRPVETVD